MDAVEQLPLQSGQLVCWLRWVDELTGAVLGTVVFPPRHFSQVPLGQVQQALRRQLDRWGLPQCLRVDNGVPWGSCNDLPTVFALWVVGLGVRWHWNDPCCPQQNPKIERAQGTGQRGAEPGTCHTSAERPARLDEADRLQREEYRTRAGGSRLERFPGRRHSGRKYSQAWERRAWDLGLVEEHRAEYVGVRRVGAHGNVGIYDRARYVGRQYAGQLVQVQYDPQAHGWLISAHQGNELRRHEAPEISPEHMVQMTCGKPSQGR